MPAKRELYEYRRKRDFDITPEPRGKSRLGRSKGLQFVVQKHDATRLHYDFRLEHDGVLKSWAVPKEPTGKPGVRRLAVQTEDHPLEYGTFEGEIPEDQYGAGSVVIWDRGRWVPDDDVDTGLAEGKLSFRLHGDRLTGRWSLIRLEDSGGRKPQENWLLIKRSDRPQIEKGDSSSTTAGHADHKARQPNGGRRAPMPAEVIPQLAALVSEPPAGDDWLNEVKLDGYRLICRVANGKAVIFTRRGNDWTDRFPTIADRAASLPCKSALLDGEAVVFAPSGLPSFQQLQSAIKARNPGITYVVFDLLYLDGRDLRDVPLINRKALLRDLLVDVEDSIQYGDHVEGNGPSFYRQACQVGLEGIISKRARDAYLQGRSRSWLKVKCVQRQEFVIAGFTDPSGSRTGFGALLLATRDRPGEPLRYAGRVGTGFQEQSLRDLHRRLIALERKTSPVGELPEDVRRDGIHWVKPQLVAEVRFAEWTDGGLLRHATFQGLREDKPASEVVVERPTGTREEGPMPSRVRISSPDKVIYPDEGITKRQLAEYWRKVAPKALPLISERPLTLLRCPDGIAGQCFYQKHIGEGMPDAVGRIRVDDDGDPYAMVTDVQSILGLVQMNTLEIHAWGSRAPHIDRPDLLVFDLDPSEKLGWADVVDAAFDIRERIESLGLVPLARVTGGKGLHVVVPVVPGPTWPAVKRFTRALVDEMVKASPDRYTASLSKTKRVGKVFIDYLRNEREATAIASYSPRAKPGAPIALPMHWAELRGSGDERPRVGLLDAPSMLKGRRDPWRNFEQSRRSLTG